MEELLRVLLLLMRPMMDLKILLLLLLGMNIAIAVFYSVVNNHIVMHLL